MLKIKIFIIFIFLVNTNHQLHGQHTFQKTYGGLLADHATFVEQTTDGGYISGGFTKSYGAGYFDILLVRTDAFGDTIWTKIIGDQYYNKIQALKQTTDGGFILTGFTDYDVFLMKMSAAGVVQWYKTYGMPQTTGASSVNQTADGGYVLTGSVHIFGMWHSFLIKAGSSGNTEWIRLYGGFTTNHSTCVVQTPDGGYILSGSSYEQTSSSWIDCAIIKTNSVGDTLWTRKFGMQGNHDIGYSIINVPGGYTFTGQTHGINSKAFLMHLDLSGNVVWGNVYFSASSNIPTNQQITLCTTNDGGYFIAVNDPPGFSFIQVMKTDMSGNVQWTKAFGEIGLNGYLGSGTKTSDGGYMISGTVNWTGAGLYDMMLIKTDSMGNSGCNDTNITVTAIPFVPQFQQYDLNVLSYNDSTKVIDLEIASGIMIGTECTTVGINESSPDVSMEPVLVQNPFRDELQIKYTRHEAVITIFDAAGRIISKQSTTPEITTINTTQFSTGFYYVQYLHNGKSHCLKAVKY